MGVPEIRLDFVREAVGVTPTEELDHGVLAIRLGCSTCKHGVDLIAVAEASEIVPALRGAGISYHVRGRSSEGSQASWKVSQAACSPEACPSGERVNDIRDMLIEHATEAATSVEQQ